MENIARLALLAREFMTTKYGCTVDPTFEYSHLLDTPIIVGNGTSADGRPFRYHILFDKYCELVVKFPKNLVDSGIAVIPRFKYDPEYMPVEFIGMRSADQKEGGWANAR